MQRTALALLALLSAASCSDSDRPQARADEVLDELDETFTIRAPSKNVEDYYAELFGAAFDSADDVVIRSIDGAPILLLTTDGGYETSDEPDLAVAFDASIAEDLGGGVVVHRGVAIVVTGDVDEVRASLDED